MTCAIARQLAEHPRWEWKPGMVDNTGRVWTKSHVVTGGAHWAPDIEHPATKGWLLAMLREATGAFDACTVCPPHVGWTVIESADLAKPRTLGRGPSTEGEALARALLAAWGES